MQLPTVLSTPTSNTGRGLLSPAFGRSWLAWSAQTAPPCRQMPLHQRMPFYQQNLFYQHQQNLFYQHQQNLFYQQMQLCHQDLMPDDAVVNRGSARRATISDFDVRLVSPSETVITSTEDKEKDEASNTDRQSGYATDQLSNRQKGRLVCEHCNADFAYKRTLDRHKQTLHDGDRLLPQCTVCYKQFRRLDALMKHVREFHVEGRGSFPCDICGQSLPTRFELKQHSDIHAKTKKNQCQFCGEFFTGLSELVQHKRCHYGVKDKELRCGKCSMAFQCKWKLLKHQKGHVKSVLKCDKCSGGFSSRVALSHHKISVHGNGKFHVCTICSEKFALKKSLARHCAARHEFVQGVITSSETSTRKKNAITQVNTYDEYKEVAACSKAGTRKTCSEPEKWIVCNEHAKEIPEDLKDHCHFPGKMTSRWIAMLSANQQ